jgi:ribonuclease P protein component
MTIVSLKGKKRIAETFRYGKRFSMPAATLIAVFSRDNAVPEIIEVLVVVKKKTAKKAVVRNRVRRLVRECIRQMFGTNKQKVHCETMVVIWNSAPKRPSLLRLHDVHTILRPLFERAQIITPLPNRTT